MTEIQYDIYNHFSNIEELRGRSDPEAVKAVAKEIEALFVYEMIKAMRETTETTSKNGIGSGIYMSMFDMELARLFADRGFGLQDVLVKGEMGNEEKAEVEKIRS